MSQALKRIIREQALSLGFEDVGFTDVAPFHLYVEEIQRRPAMYHWVQTDSFSTLRGSRPASKHPWARSIVVLIRNYHRKSFPEHLLHVYGRCYMVDERKIRGEEYLRFKSLLDFLKGLGIHCLYDEELPARMAAARAGITQYGNNCFAFARNSMGRCSWLEIIPLLVDVELQPDEPSMVLGCPQNCKMECLKACPTGALYEPLRMEPQKCIAFLTYYGPQLTPIEFREPMGTWIYGCDLCQEACPINKAWAKRPLALNQDLMERGQGWDLRLILDMNLDYYQEKLWPQFFYISRSRPDRWQMNAARALGNVRDTRDIPLLARKLKESPFENVRAMCAWALGRMGSASARRALERALGDPSETVRKEVQMALG
ncbi:MAG: 4Fe-4S double cluster binding domain-containing protein [bacterium]